LNKTPDPRKPEEYYGKDYFTGELEKKCKDTGYCHEYNWETPQGKILGNQICSCFEFKTVIDIGCCNGTLIDYFLKCGKDAIGIEVSKFAIEKAKNPSKIIQANFLKMDNDEIGVFDIVVSISTFEHFPPECIEDVCKKTFAITKNFLIVALDTGANLAHLSRDCDVWVDNLSKAGFRLFYECEFHHWKRMFLFSVANRISDNIENKIKQMWIAVDKTNK